VREHGKGKERRVQDKKERGSNRKTALHDKSCGTHWSKKKKVHFLFFNGAPR